MDIFFQQMNHVVIKQVPSKTLRDIYSKLRFLKLIYRNVSFKPPGGLNRAFTLYVVDRKLLVDFPCRRIFDYCL